MLGLGALWLKRWNPLLVVHDLGLLHTLGRCRHRRVESVLCILVGRALGVLWRRLGGLLSVNPGFGLLLSFLSIQTPVGPLLQAVSAVLFLL